MPNYKLLLPLFLFACNNPEKNPADNAGPATSPTSCYRYINNKDTVTLKLITVGENMTGILVYNFFEKDRNEGTIQGFIKNGILLVNYNFRSEGMYSQRQVAFKKTGDNYTEGFGEMEMIEEKMRFANTDSLDFSKGIVLKPFDCK